MQVYGFFDSNKEERVLLLMSGQAKYTLCKWKHMSNHGRSKTKRLSFQRQSLM